MPLLTLSHVWAVYVDGTNLESDAILKNACGEINLSVGLDTPVAALQRWCMRRASSALLIVDAPQDAKPEEALASLVRGVPRTCGAALSLFCSPPPPPVPHAPMSLPTT